MPESQISAISLGPWTSTLIAVAALGLVLADVWLRRRHRRHAWLVAPQRLLEKPAFAGWLLWAAVPIAFFATGAVVPHFGAAAAPFTCWLAALALLGAGHLSGILPLGAVGQLLACIGVAVVPRAWFGIQDVAVVIGLSLAALWTLWLAQFWKQQLLDGHAWTTTGRLIPAARTCTMLLAGGMLLGCLALRLRAPDWIEYSVWSAFLGSSLQILLVSACWRRALLDNSIACALAGSLAACSAAIVPWVPGVEPLFILALVAAGAIFLVRRSNAAGDVRLVVRLLVMLLIPCIGGLIALATPWSGMVALGLGLIGLAALGGVCTLALAQPAEP
jgi:hypothetical protein